MTGVLIPVPGSFFFLYPWSDSLFTPDAAWLKVELIIFLVHGTPASLRRGPLIPERHSLVFTLHLQFYSCPPSSPVFLISRFHKSHYMCVYLYKMCCCFMCMSSIHPLLWFIRAVFPTPVSQTILWQTSLINPGEIYRKRSQRWYCWVMVSHFLNCSESPILLLTAGLQVSTPWWGAGVLI